MDAALLFLAVTAAGALILALVRTVDAPTAAAFHPHEPVEMTVHEESKTISLDDLPPELQAQGTELAQLALKSKTGAAGLTQADKERMVELARTIAERAPASSSHATAHSTDGAIRLVHVETHAKVDVDS